MGDFAVAPMLGARQWRRSPDGRHGWRGSFDLWRHGRSKGTASRTVGLLGGIFTFAREREIVRDNPVHGVKRFRDKQVGRFLSEQELSQLGQALAALESEEIPTL
jgi:hypothetical protein